MYFYTQAGGKREISAFAQVATFFIDKFPAAYGAVATYTNAKGTDSDSAYIYIDVASSLEYDVSEVEDEGRAQSITQYQSRVLDTFKQKTEAEQAVLLLEILYE